MATTPSSFASRLQLGRGVRERYLADLGRALVLVASEIETRLTELMGESAASQETQLRREAWSAYQQAQTPWVDLTQQAWRHSLSPTSEARLSVPVALESLELQGTDVVESKIQASRMLLEVEESVASEFNDVRVRLKRLERLEELERDDPMRPQVLLLLLAEQWSKAGMPAQSWSLVSAVVQRTLMEHMKQAFRQANATLIQSGVLPVIELRDRVKAPTASEGAPRNTPRDAPAATAPGGLSTQPPGGWTVPQGTDGNPPTSRGPAAATPFWQAQPGSTNGAGERDMAYSTYGMADETRMLTVATPLGRARSRAQGVIGQLKRIFTDNAGADFAATATYQPNTALAQAISAHTVAARVVHEQEGFAGHVSPAAVARLATDLRDSTVALKNKAGTKSEKATIEIVALMFQAILAEERIPPAIRVWFARLQMPVLRMALEDADFLSSSEHPSRVLIDRMGSSVMGFDGTGVQSGAMEAEIKRIVQVVEQYPETGKKVYQIVLSEFQKFLAKFLTESDSTRKVVSVAQQVEQKETLAIQYTIEMRNQLQDLPVRDEIRDFLFKVWAEVLAVCALRKGARDEETLAFKKCATDLVWAASAKPNRTERARVIQDLPPLLLRLRSGMALLAMSPSEQEGHIKSISGTLADAFLSKTQAIAQERIDAMAQRLTDLEDYVSDDVVGDLPLDANSLEVMLGIDASTIEVVSGGGSTPSAAMQAWAAELQLGSWYMLDHNSQRTTVQFAWRSERGHFNLFAATHGGTFLLQASRLAAYLQAGLMLPQEEETLTVRATRDALAKIQANPERLLT